MLMKILGMIILLYGLLIGVSSIFIEKRVAQLKSDEFIQITKEFERETLEYIEAKKESILHLAYVLANDRTLKNSLLSGNASPLDLSSFSQYLYKNTTINDVLFHVVDKDIKSFYRSSEYKKDKNFLDDKILLSSVIKNRIPETKISITSMGMTIKVITPIFDKRRVIGALEILTNFDAIARDMKIMGTEPIVLVDKSYRAQFSTNTNRFIQEYYLISKSSKLDNFNFLKSQNIQNFLSLHQYYYQNKERDILILLNTLHDDKDKVIAHFIYFKSLLSIDLSHVYEAKRDFYILISISYLFLVMIILFTYMKRNSKSMEQFNMVLQHRVEEKTDELYEQKVFLQEVIDGVSDSVMVISADYSIIMMNKIARESLDNKYIKDRDIPRCYEVLHKKTAPCEGKDYPCPLRDVMKDRINTTVLHSHSLNKDEISYYELSATPLINDNGDIEGIIEVGHNITTHILTQLELRKQKDNLRHLAHHDTLTGLPNRLLFLDRLEHAIKLASRMQQSLAVLYLDLDHFKQINDSLGHSAGDFLLETIARRFQKSVREVDTVARLGGDEFTIILEGYEHGIIGIIHKLIDEVAQPIKYKNHELYTSVSIGISMYPKDGEDTETLLRNADAAMYKAKEVGRNRHQFYTADMTDKAMEWVSMESAMRKGLEEDEFVLEYQPQYDSRDNSLIGMEALVRWDHPTLGRLSPGNFIPLAEESSLIISLGMRILKLAAQQTTAWHAEGFKPGRVAVNISVKQLQERDFIFKIASILKEANCSPSWIEIEVTEGCVMYDTDQAIGRLKEIKRMGILLAMDDFGTGYSSLSLLKRLPIHKLKIDYSFIRDIPEDEESKAIAMTVIELAKNMNLEVLAEGVETQAQNDFLEEHGCYYIQGYLYNKPLSVEAITKLLQKSL